MNSGTSLISLGKPVVLLNGLVTDKNNYSDEQMIKMLQSKNNPKFKIPKNPKIIKHTFKVSNNAINLKEDGGDNNIKIMSKLQSLTEAKNKKENSVSQKSEEQASNNKDDSNSKNTEESKSLIDLGRTKKKTKNKFITQTQTDTKILKKRKKPDNNVSISDFSSENDITSKSIYNTKSNISEKEPSHTSNNSINSFKKSIRKIFQSENPSLSQLKIDYKTVPQINTYEEIINTKNTPGMYMTLFNEDDLKNIIEEKSQTFLLLKKINKENKEKKEKKEKREKIIVIISGKNKEMNLNKSLLYLLKQKDKLSLFHKISPDNNNILQYMPYQYIGINNYGFMNINYYFDKNNNSNNNKNDEEIHFISNFFYDKNDKYILLFRKYILNLSCFKSNEININDGDYNLYHIIIPKNSINKINIDFNEEKNIYSLLNKLNCEYYFICQKPGELLIVEPESILLSYYYCKVGAKNSEIFEKNYLIMFWNKMNIDVFSDYIILKNDCKNEKFKLFPIVNTLLNLANKAYNILSDDIIKIILEIYNDLDVYENINNYIEQIKENNIWFHKLFLNNIYLCENCSQEIFNFFVYDGTSKNFNWDEKKLLLEENTEINDNNNNNNSIYLNKGQFICINCANKKNFFSIQKNIIFFKYTKEQIINFISGINSKINKNKNNNINNNNLPLKKEIISEIFNIERKNDCINIDEFLLKIDGPLRLIDSDYEKKKNGISNRDIKIDKYLKYLENNDSNKNNNNVDIDPLSYDNFGNINTSDDLYEKISLNNIYMDTFHNINNPNNNSNKSKNNNMSIDFMPFNNFYNVDKDEKNKDSKDVKDKKDLKKNSSKNGNMKSKKNNKTNLQDIIFSGEF